MQRGAGRAARQARDGAAASSLLGRQLLLDLLQPRALLEAAHAVDHAGGHVRAHAGLPAVRVDGEDVGRAAQRAHHHPAAVVAERDVLHLRKGAESAACASRKAKRSITFQTNARLTWRWEQTPPSLGNNLNYCVYTN